VRRGLILGRDVLYDQQSRHGGDVDDGDDGEDDSL
jgi:hypothetical protein